MREPNIFVSDVGKNIRWINKTERRNMTSTVKEIDHSKDPIYTRAVDDTRHKIIDDLKKLIAIQSSNGNWNYDAYMYGLANGLIMAESIVSNKEPVFLDAPKKWLKDYPTLWTKIKWFFHKPNPVSGVEVPGATNEKMK